MNQHITPLPRRLNIGCGFDKRPGFVNVDMDPACQPDVLIKNGDLSIIPQYYFDEVVAKDVLEHIDRAQTLGALLDWACLLRERGNLWLQTSSILGVADQLRAQPKYADQHGWTICLFGNQVQAGDYHLTGFTETTLRVHLLAAGFEVDSFETVDKWLFRVTAHKRESWDGFLRRHGNSDDSWFVTDLFDEAFGRKPDYQGERYCLNELKAGRKRRDIAKHVFSAPERLFATASRFEL